ncbi:MAG: hypothetical protein IJ890_00270 [Clostridia bacterium]|nr:hypothetical protein [Clostridia bacterium]
MNKYTKKNYYQKRYEYLLELLICLIDSYVDSMDSFWFGIGWYNKNIDKRVVNSWKKIQEIIEIYISIKVYNKCIEVIDYL